MTRIEKKYYWSLKTFHDYLSSESTNGTAFILPLLSMKILNYLTWLESHESLKSISFLLVVNHSSNQLIIKATDFPRVETSNFYLQYSRWKCADGRICSCTKKVLRFKISWYIRRKVTEAEKKKKLRFL